MASTAGGSGAGGGDRCPSGEKGTTRVGRRSKKPSAFHRAALRYLEKEYRECMARGEEPPFDLEDLLRRRREERRGRAISAARRSGAWPAQVVKNTNRFLSPSPVSCMHGQLGRA